MIRGYLVRGQGVREQARSYGIYNPMIVGVVRGYLVREQARSYDRADRQLFVGAALAANHSIHVRGQGVREQGVREQARSYGRTNSEMEESQR